MVDRSRKIVLKPAESLDIKYQTLGSALKEIAHLIEKYGENASIDTYSYPYNDTEYLYVYAERPETDKEMHERILQEEHMEKRREEQDRREFERLKKKFESNEISDL